MSIETTIISEQKDREIVKIESGNKCLILYAYKNMTIILNGNKDEPYIISTLSKDTIEIVINNTGFLPITLFELLMGSNGTIIGDQDMYYASKVVLETVKLYDENSKKINKIYYKGKPVSLDKKDNTYYFHFPNRRTIRITLEAMSKLLKFNKVIICPNGVLIELILNNNTINCKYLNISTIDNNTYIINLSDVDLSKLKLMELLTYINNYDKILSEIIITSDEVVIPLNNINSIECELHTTLGSMLDLVTDIASNINGKFVIKDKDTEYTDCIECNILYNTFTNTVLDVVFNLEICNTIKYKIFSKYDIRKLLINAIIERIVDDRK